MKLKDDNYYKNYTNDELIDEIESGLRNGYWDKTLIPELKKRLKEYEKMGKLLELYKELITVKDDLFDCCEIVDDEFYDIRKIETDLEKQIKELENELFD